MLKAFVRLNRTIAQKATRHFPLVFASEDYLNELKGRVLEGCTKRNAQDLLEVGGIDRPLLKRSHRYTYHGLDVEAKAQCASIYDGFTVQSIEDPLSQQYDLIFSTTVLEHVRDNARAFASIFAGLRPGGETHHYVPSKHHPYSLCLRLVGPRLQRVLISHLRPWAGLEITGYPAFFNHCSPNQMRKLLAKSGFEDIEIRHYYRANDYFAFFLPAFLAVTLFENLCRGANWHFFCSGIVISARKPALPK
jgi:SAM-dependent methyltransferase